MEVKKMNPSFDAHPILSTVGFMLVIGSSILCICKRRKRRRLNNSIVNQGRYTKIQILGILGVIFFMFPVSWITLTYLLKGAMLLLLLIIGFLRLPETIKNSVILLFQLASIFITIMGLYFVCEIVWPKKQNTSKPLTINSPGSSSGG